MDKEKADKASRAQYSTKIREDFPETLVFGDQTYL